MAPEVIQVTTPQYQNMRMYLREMARDDSILQEAAKDSFFDYHAKGVHYLSLGRGPNHERLKLYYFEKPATRGAVVCPHDHVYNFDTIVFSGEVTDEWFTETDKDNPDADVHQKFQFDSPLRGGDGFRWDKTVGLVANSLLRVTAGYGWTTPADAVHTLHIRKPGTVLLQRQWESIKDISDTFVPGDDKDPPSLTGLYKKPTAGQLRSMVRKILG